MAENPSDQKLTTASKERSAGQSCYYCASGKVAMSEVNGVMVCFYCQQRENSGTRQSALDGLLERLRTGVSTFDKWPNDAAALRAGNDWVASDGKMRRSLSVGDLRELLAALERLQHENAALIADNERLVNSLSGEVNESERLRERIAMLERENAEIGRRHLERFGLKPEDLR